jgi:signal transduction histidine kinase
MKWPFTQDHADVLDTDQPGCMEKRMRAFDWTATSIGGVAEWPQSLKSAVRLLIDCQLPMYLAWGPEFLQFYNDAYVPILGNKDADAIGRDARVTWSEIWPTIGPMWGEVLEGKGIGADRFKLTIERYGYPEDCYFSFSYSPVPDDHGNATGVLVTFAETTNTVLAEQRQAFQLNLSDALRDLRDPVAITELAASMLGQYLGAGRSGYGEINVTLGTVTVHTDWTDGTMTSLAGESRPLDSFGPQIIAELQGGHVLRLDDIGADPRSAPYADGYASIGTKSLLIIPLLKEGVLAAILYLHCAEPHHWLDRDVRIAEDVAHRTWDAAERAYAERELLEADRRKDEFLAMLAHELRNPLSPICSAAEMLKIGTSEAIVKRASEVISRQAKHLTMLVNDLLDVSRVTKGLVELNKSDIDLSFVIDSAVEQSKPLLDSKGHALVVHNDVHRLIVNADRTRLVQAFSNLLNNAGKYTPEGGEITLSVFVEGNRVLVEIKDNGVGIGAELLPRVFDLFTQAQRTPDRAQGGLGIGLALVKTIVTLHGGEVVAYSSGHGAGSKFTVSLPLARKELEQVQI